MRPYDATIVTSSGTVNIQLWATSHTAVRAKLRASFGPYVSISKLSCTPYERKGVSPTEATGNGSMALGSCFH